MVRRDDCHPRLRQEHARLHHGHGPLEPPGLAIYGGTIRPGELAGRPLDIVSALEATASFSPAASTTPPAGRSSAIPAPARGLRRNVYGQHDVQRDRGPGHVAAL